MLKLRWINEARQNLTRNMDNYSGKSVCIKCDYTCHTTTLQQRYLFFEQLVWFVPKLRGFVLRVCLIYLYKILSVILQHSLNTNQTLRLTKTISSTDKITKLYLSSFTFSGSWQKFHFKKQYHGTYERTIIRV